MGATLHRPLGFTALAFVLLLASASATSAAGIRSAQAEPGNVLILIADDMGVDQFRPYGVGPNPAPTPNLERMAAEGVLFLNAWAEPLCSATRATIQTGRYGFRTGIGATINPFVNEAGLPLSEVTLPEMLDLGTGGATAHAMIGKWHLSTLQGDGQLAPNLAGYGHFAGSFEGQLPSYTAWRRIVNGVGTPTSRYATSACVDDALGWIGAQDRPWLCVVSFQAPHAPYHRPPPGLHTQVLPPGEPPISCYESGIDPEPFYRAMVEAMDTEIGRLMAGLPERDRERTTVFFLGDNGTEWCLTPPSFPPGSKSTLTERGVRVPFLAWGHRVEDSGWCRSLVNTTDLFATVAELEGVDLEATLPGHVLDSNSLVPLLEDRSRKVRDWAYAEVFMPNGAGLPIPLPACPDEPECQPTIALGGPGQVTLTSCGPPLYGRQGLHSVPWRLSGAPPGAHAWLLIGPESIGFAPSIGGLLVSTRPSFVGHYRVGPDGALAHTTWTGDTSHDRFYQFVVLDPAQYRGFALSNAVRLNKLWTNMRAVRRERYKLVRSNPCLEELFDLFTDPFEQDDLLRRPLSSPARVAYDRLALVLDTL